ncbi:TPA: DUF6392 family protein [Pseudomonas aeruginosa]|nr:hypothetical protein [Pseudomonas aeruginosa]HEH9916105.1 hypothetical protein [Pseudomonas aeruginosa]
MNPESIKELVGALGKSYSELVERKLIPAGPLVKQYEESDWLTLDVDVGVDLEFWAETRASEKLHIVLIRTMDDIPAYQGELPSPFSRSMDKAVVRSFLGVPDSTKEPFKMPVVGMVGGWDSYTHPERSDIRIFFRYTPDLKVSTLSFALKEPGHN